MINQDLIGSLYLEKMMIFSSLIHLVLAIFQIIYIKFIKIIILLQMYLPKTKKFGCVGRGDLTCLFFSKVVKY